MKWLQGKKTYISAVALFLAAAVGWWFGGVNATEAAGMIATAFGLVGLGARSTRYSEMVLLALEDIKQARAEGRKIDIAAEVEKVIAQPSNSGVETTRVPAK